MHSLLRFEFVLGVRQLQPDWVWFITLTRLL